MRARMHRAVIPVCCGSLHGLVSTPCPHAVFDFQEVMPDGQVLTKLVFLNWCAHGAVCCFLRTQQCCDLGPWNA